MKEHDKYSDYSDYLKELKSNIFEKAVNLETLK